MSEAADIGGRFQLRNARTGEIVTVTAVETSGYTLDQDGTETFTVSRAVPKPPKRGPRPKKRLARTKRLRKLGQRDEALELLREARALYDPEGIEKGTRGQVLRK